MRHHKLLNEQQITEFHRDGFIVLKGFYDLAQDILNIQSAIYNIIGLVISKYNLSITRQKFSAAHFDSGFQELIYANRSYGAEVYDAVKQIPAFIKLLGHPAHEKLFLQLRSEAIPAVAAGGFGIRIDNPNEDIFRANWHQEYPAQLRSIDGLVYWSPLVPITKNMGPVNICPGSHTDGPLPVYTKDPNNPEKKGAYSLRLANEEELLAKHSQTAPLINPGDLIIMDFLVLHASGLNRSKRSRWSMQFRYFNFANPIGLSYGWQGSYAENKNFCNIHPELCIN